MVSAQRVTKDGKTRYRVQIRRPSKGIAIDEYFATRRDADRAIRQYEHAIANGIPITENVHTRETFEGAVAAYLDDPDAMRSAKGRPLKPSAASDRRTRLTWLVRECFGPITLRRLTWTKIDAELAAKARAHGWSSATRYRYETALSRLLEYARRRRWVGANAVTDQQRLNETEARQRTFTDAEWARLLAAADDAGGMLAMFLRLSWETGCRKSELLKLRWVDIDPVDHLTLGAALSITDTKNRDDRRVYISRTTLHLLQAHEQQFRLPSSPLVFPSRTRDGRYAVDVPYRTARRAAGLDESDERHGELLTIHHIRHTWATRLGERGATLAQLMAAGGWRTAAMAMRYMKRREVQAMEAAAMLVDRAQ